MAVVASTPPQVEVVSAPVPARAQPLRARRWRLGPRAPRGTVAASSPPALSQVLALGRTRAASGYRWLAALAAIWAAASLVADAVARVAPPSAWLDAITRTLGLGAAVLTISVGLMAWIVRREARWLLLGASLAPPVVALRVLAGGVVSALELPTFARLLDGGLGLGELGALVWVATLAGPAPRARLKGSLAAEDLFRRMAEVSVLVVFLAALGGVAVQAAGASWACRGFPDCNGLGVLPFGRGTLADLHVYHRLLAYVATALVIWLAVEARRTQRHLPALAQATLVLAAATLAESAIGAVAVSTGVPPLVAALHTLGAVATWASVVVVAVLAHRQPIVVPAPSVHVAADRRTSRALATVKVYLQLTKPKVMSLLLATTAAAMCVAERGLPPVGLLVATLVGGALMSGGAGAINHYIDRDIDPLMGRTAWRPIPSGAVAPRRALWFGIGLGALATVVFVAFVNALAAALALVGLLGYVFVYSLWLKRSTPSNIVIGGAAGAIPPLVGWAAVTGEIGSLTAWYLFAIVFFWTPPHFWALSLLIRKHYERARVPMLPVVRGEAETRRQILLYSLLLVALTLVLSPFRLMGLLYFVVALGLGGLFIAAAVGLWRRPTPRAARGVYTYSILYLFALFAAMAVDRALVS